MTRVPTATKWAIAGFLFGVAAPHLVGCGPCSHQVGMSVTTKTSMNGNGVTGGTVMIKGSNFNPGSAIQVSYSGIPNRPGSVSGGGPTAFVQGDGTFVYQETWLCTSNDPADANVNVLVTARDPKDGCFGAQNIPASRVWVCTGGNPASSRRDGTPVHAAELRVRGCNTAR